MKLVWSPETALESYLDTIKSCDGMNQSGEAEFLAATAGGWNAKLIVEAWAPGAPTSVSVGLSITTRHTKGRHICIVANQLSKTQYISVIHEFGAMRLPEIIVGDAEEVMATMEGVDFMVIDSRRKDLVRLLRSVKVSQRGAVLLCTNVRERTVEGFKWDDMVGDRGRVVRSVVLPVGGGLDIAHVGYGGCGQGNVKEKAVAAARSRRRWIRHVDVESGEEHLFRRC